jgi:hypothetical protein
MSHIIKFDSAALRPKKSSPPDSKAIKLVNLSAEIDALILHTMKKEGCDPAEIAAVMANRLGELIHALADDKDALLAFCAKVIKEKAEVA